MMSIDRKQWTVCYKTPRKGALIYRNYPTEKQAINAPQELTRGKEIYYKYGVTAPAK